jgi:hypothetical protein
MDALRLDLVETSGRRRGAGVLLLAAGAVAVFLVAYRHADLQGKAQTLESRVSHLERQATGLGTVDTRSAESTGQEIQRANEVIDQLALPWDRLFRAVEGVAVGQVTLLGIAPDARTGTVQIRAETADSEAMFAYVQRLEKQSELADVYLLEHQREKRGPLRFVVTASWLAAQHQR